MNGPPELNARQAHFCHAYTCGDAVGNATQAYRTAYRCAGASAKSVSGRASRLLRNPAVAAEVTRLRGIVVDRTGLTVQRHLQELDRIKTRAIEKGQMTAAARCEELRGRAMGYYTERVQMQQQVSSRSDEELFDEIVEAIVEDPTGFLEILTRAAVKSDLLAAGLQRFALPESTVA